MTTPNTPSSSSQRTFTGSGLHISIVTTINLIEQRQKGSKFIKFGDYEIVFSSEANLAGVQVTTSNTQSLQIYSFFEPIAPAFTSHIFVRGDPTIDAQDVIMLQGSVCPWAFRTRNLNDPDVDETWETLVHTSMESIQHVNNLTLQGSHMNALQKQWIGCSFLGRVREQPDPNVVKFNANMASALSNHGVYIELSFYFNVADDQKDNGLLPRKAYPFYIFLLFDDNARRRYSWAIKEKKVRLKDGDYFFCAGRIVGKFKDMLINSAGHEKGSSVDKSPIYVVVVGEQFRPSANVSGQSASGFEGMPGATIPATPSTPTTTNPLARRLNRSSHKEMSPDVLGPITESDDVFGDDDGEAPVATDDGAVLGARNIGATKGSTRHSARLQGSLGGKVGNSDETNGEDNSEDEDEDESEGGTVNPRKRKASEEAGLGSSRGLKFPRHQK